MKDQVKSLRTNPHLLLLARWIRYPQVRRKYYNVLWMIIVFLFSPKKLYKYSVRSSLPSGHCRDKFQDDIFKLYSPSVEANFKIDKDDRTLYTRGFVGNISSFSNVFLINYPITEENRNATFITGEEPLFRNYLKNGVKGIYIKLVIVNDKGQSRELNPISENQSEIEMLTLYLKTNYDSEYIPYGSGIASILALSLVSKSVEVYGWNHYQLMPLSSMGTIRFIINVFFYLRDYKTRDCVEYSLMHLHFAYYFRGIENLTIHGNLDYFDNEKLNRLFTKRIQAVFLNS